MNLAIRRGITEEFIITENVHSKFFDGARAYNAARSSQERERINIKAL